MKKITILLISTLCLILFCGFDATHTKVYDYANLLSQKEIDTLQSEVVALAQEYQLDIILVTTDNADGKSSRRYANDFYDNNSFGYDSSNKSGVLLLIDMDNREVFILGNGVGSTVFNNTAIDAMTAKIAPHLTSENYMKACETFLSQVSSRMNNYSVHGQSEVIQHQLIYWGISLTIAIIAVVIMIFSQKTKMTANGHTYMTNSKYNLRATHDRFTHTTTVKRKIETKSSSNSSGGSSSSSGRSGGGRSF